MGKKAAVFCMVVLAASMAWGLDVGGKAPALTILKWVKGDPVDPSKPDGKTTYVVEFWATWCPPCRQSIPHLSELQQKYKDKGVVVIGISNEELKEVEPFVNGQKQMEYRVAVDKNDETNSAWMEGVDGIPHAFVVDKNGVVVWAGHPMEGLDATIEQMVAGTFDAEKAKKVAAKKAELQEAIKSRDLDKLLAAVDGLIQLDPTNYEHHNLKMRALGMKGDAAALAKARQQAAQVFIDAKAAEPLNNLAWELAASEDLSQRDPEVALKCAEEAAKLCERKSAHILDTLARAYYSIGMLDKAIAVQKEAVAAAPDEQQKQQVEKALKFYEAARALNARLTGAGK